MTERSRTLSAVLAACGAGEPDGSLTGWLPLLSRSCTLTTIITSVPMQASRRESAQGSSHPRIEREVDEIDNEIDHQRENRREEDEAQNRIDVVVQNALNRVLSRAAP